MINTPFHKLTAEQKETYKKEKVYLHDFANRSQRRSLMKNKNLVRQDVPIKDEIGNVICANVVFHKKTTNLPFQYLGIKPVNGSISAKIIDLKATK